MNRWIARVATFASLAGTVALVPAGIAYAQQGSTNSAEGGPKQGHHGHHVGLLGAAKHLDSLTAGQKTAVEQLVETRRTAEVPVRQADAQVLTTLARQVEQASIDKAALAPAVQARDLAAQAAHATDRDTLQKLHDLLTPAQRAELIDKVEAHSGRPGAHGHPGGPDAGPNGDDHEHGPMAMYAKRLGLTDAQKAQILSNLKAEAAGPGMHGDGGAPGEHRAARKAWLESFKGDTFSATAQNGPQTGERGENMENLLQAAVPVLSPAQRAQVASDLRARAAHESHS